MDIESAYKRGLPLLTSLASLTKPRLIATLLPMLRELCKSAIETIEKGCLERVSYDDVPVSLLFRHAQGRVLINATEIAYMADGCPPHSIMKCDPEQNGTVIAAFFGQFLAGFTKSTNDQGAATIPMKWARSSDPESSGYQVAKSKTLTRLKNIGDGTNTNHDYSLESVFTTARHLGWDVMGAFSALEEWAGLITLDSYTCSGHSHVRIFVNGKMVVMNDYSLESVFTTARHLGWEVNHHRLTDAEFEERFA